MKKLGILNTSGAQINMGESLDYNTFLCAVEAIDRQQWEPHYHTTTATEKRRAWVELEEKGETYVRTTCCGPVRISNRTTEGGPQSPP